MSQEKLQTMMMQNVLVCLRFHALGNLLLVYVISRDTRLTIITNIFIHNLALIGISMATLHMPFWVVSMSYGNLKFSPTWCEASASIQFTLGMASILNMGLIALNRYIRVVKPTLCRKLFARIERPGFTAFLFG